MTSGIPLHRTPIVPIAGEINGMNLLRSFTIIRIEFEAIHPSDRLDRPGNSPFKMSVVLALHFTYKLF